MRPLVDTEIRADAVTGAVAVVDAVLPHGIAGQGVNLCAADAVGETGECQADVSLEDERVVEPFFVGQRAEGDGSRNVGRAVLILSAAVEQQQSFGFEHGIRLGRCFVVNDGSMRSVGDNRVEGESSVQVLLRPQSRQLPVDADFCLSSGFHSRLQPMQELHHRHAVAHHRPAETGYLGSILDRLQRPYQTSP